MKASVLGCVLTLVLASTGGQAWAESPNCVDDEGSFIGQATEIQDIAELDDGTLYAVDGEKAHVFRRSVDGLFYTVSGGDRGYADGSMAEARFMGPYGVASGGDRLYIVDTRGQRLRVLLDDQIVTVAGDGKRGFKDGTGATARFAHPVDAVVLPSGAILVADKLNHAIRRVIVGDDPSTSVVQTVAGNGLPGLVNGPSDVAQFRWPVGVAVGPDDSIYVADQGNHAIRRIWPDGVVTTWVGGIYGYHSASRNAARLGYIGRITSDSDGWLYITDRVVPGVLSIDPHGLVTPLTGTGIGSGTGNADGSHYRFPEGITVTAAGEVLVADIGNGGVKVLAACGEITSLQGSACVGPVCDMTLDDTYGCTDSSATNHNPDAELDNGSCIYACEPSCENGGSCNAVGHCVCVGTGHHGPTCAEADIASCPTGAGPAFEVCDGVDNDCNGQIDDAIGTVSCGIGGCAQTVDACANGIELDCDPLALKADEICDGVDNDCDGQTDEGQGAAYCGFGVCKRLVSGCVNGVPTDCNPLDGATNESCNTLDDDCDGKVDEAFGEVLCGTGVCRHVQQNCISGVTQTCDPMKGAYGEVCDGLDNDCDGETDEGTGQVSCGVGACEKTIDTCVGGVPQSCNALAGATAEVCDGLDNDCNGLTDDALMQISCGLGACAHSVPSCLSGVPQICDPMEGVKAEVCGDGVDDDCDGVADDGCPADVDDDGYGEDVDCDDGNPAIHPGAVEVCDDQTDNNCDGQTDEGCDPASYCPGDVFVGSLAGVQDISHCETVDGDLVIEGVSSLVGLEGLREVTGKLRLKNLSGVNLAPLSDLETVGGLLELIFNTQLETLSHLSKLTSVGGLYIYMLPKVTSLDGLQQIDNLSGSLTIQEMDLLADVDALSNITTVGGDLRIEDNEVLGDLMGLSSLVSVGNNVVLDNNDELASLDGLASLSSIGFDIGVTNNFTLCANDVAAFLDNLCSQTSCQTTNNSFNRSSDCGSCGGSICNNSCGSCAAGMTCQDELCVCIQSWERWMSWDDAVQTIELPACANELTVDLHGAQGGAYDGETLGGLGARMKCKLTGLGGQTLYMRVGSKGRDGGAAHIESGGAGGGGATAVWTETNGVKTPLVIAGGGGGASNYGGAHGEPGTIMEWGSNGGQAKGTNGLGGGTGMNDGDGYGGAGGGWNGVGETSMKWPDSSAVIASGGDVHSGLNATGGSGGFGAVAGGGQGGAKGGGGGGGYSGGGGGLVAVSTGGQLLAAIGGGGGGSLCSGVTVQATSGVSEDNGYLYLSATWDEDYVPTECELNGVQPEICDGKDNDCDGEVDEDVCYWEPAIQTIFGTKCVDCHSTKGYGGHRLADTYVDAFHYAYSPACDGLNKAECTVVRIEDGTMPLFENCGGAVADGAPNSDVCVTESELAMLKAWVADDAPQCEGDCVLGCGPGSYTEDGVTCVDCEPCPINSERLQCGFGYGPGICHACSPGMYKDVVGEWDTGCNGSGYKLITSTTEWTPPPGVTEVWVMVVGGGGGGASHHGGGGGSGESKSNYFTVDGSVTVMVGPGGGGGWGTWTSPQDGWTGGISSFGGMLDASGGKGGTAGDATAAWDGSGGNGGTSGGGGANTAGHDGCPGGNFGSDAPMCLPGGHGGYDMNGGLNPGYFTKASSYGGLGGAGGISWHPGGGGGGGLILGPPQHYCCNGSLTEKTTVGGQDGSKWYSAKGGEGFGAGGGGGGQWSFDQDFAQGGDGAPGFVYIQW